jgi:hypothetical protein
MHPKSTIFSALALGLLTASPCPGQVTYSTILASNYSVTGVRGDTGGNVLLTGSYQDSNQTTQGLLYEGPLSPTNPAGYSYLAPTFAAENVTTSVFYGPDTSVFDPSLGAGNIAVVGSYQYSESTVLNHGLLYEGPLTGGGTWTQIDVPSSAVGNATVLDTIPHSTMGNLVVGDYDLQGVPNSANAFIYDIATQDWTLFDFGNTTNDTTAYGIWQNGIGSNSYTIAGGSGAGLGINDGFLVDFNSQTGLFTHLAYYSFNGTPGIITHFEGITAVAGGFDLVATTDSGAAFATVDTNPDGSFGNATWTSISYPDSNLSTGDSVYEQTAMGIYSTPGTPGIQSYIAEVPEPSYAIFVVGLAGVVVAWRGKMRARA